MSKQEDESGEKSFEPTQKKLDDARKKGDIAKSNDVTAAAAYMGMVVGMFGAGAAAVQSAGAAMIAPLDHPDMLVGLVLAPGGPQHTFEMAGAVLWAIAPIFLVPALAAIAALMAQRAFVFAPTKLAPKLSRISPISNAKNKYGPGGLFEFAKSSVKLIVVSTVLTYVFWDQIDRVIGSVTATPEGVTAMMGDMMLQVLLVSAMILGVIAAIDMAWQISEHRRKLRMTLKELRDETKEAEGDPQLKAQRRRKAEEIATNQMIADVPRADVIIVNPTHFAVALEWDRLPGTAPVCLAKGQDEVARKIREIAEEHEIPIHSDPPTARALFATVEIGEEIQPEHYRAVAAAIQFADRMRGLTRQ